MKTVITGLEQAQFHSPEALSVHIHKKTAELRKKSGVDQVERGFIRIDQDLRMDQLVITALFDPWYWTGLPHR